MVTLGNQNPSGFGIPQGFSPVHHPLSKIFLLWKPSFCSPSHLEYDRHTLFSCTSLYGIWKIQCFLQIGCDRAYVSESSSICSLPWFCHILVIVTVVQIFLIRYEWVLIFDVTIAKITTWWRFRWWLAFFSNKLFYLFNFFNKLFFKLGIDIAFLDIMLLHS